VKINRYDPEWIVDPSLVPFASARQNDSSPRRSDFRLPNAPDGDLPRSPRSFMVLRFLHCGLAALVAVLVFVPSDAADPAKPGAALEYNRDVRPILAENCFACHGPDSAARKAKLRLDDREAAIDRGVIVPGKPEESDVIARIFMADGDKELMPPKESHKTLKPEQKEILKRWVKEGAKYQAHWSFITPQKPEVPRSRDTKWSEWGNHPIDAFVFEKLQQNKLQPNPEADRRTLIRRVAYDLTGLPPDPKDVESLVKDTSPNWYEQYVDKLMATPQWGEHRGRYWLDYVRYADTHGIHFDNYREMWSYRDWVIRAFNKNQPFDQFGIEQLAGDLLPNPTLDQQIATGFNRCNITTNEGGAINEEYLVLYTRDRTEAANQVFMGLTAGCAVCHDHKFDPLNQKEFYSMAAFFNNTTQNAMDGNIQNTPPVIPVPRDEDRPEWEKLSKDLVTARKKLAWRKAFASATFAEWRKNATPAKILEGRTDQSMPLYAWLDEGAGDQVRYVENGKPRSVPLPAGAEWKPGPTGGKALSLKPATGTVTIPTAGDYEADQPFSVGLWVQIPLRGQFASLLARMDIANGYRGWDFWMENDRFAFHLVNQWPNDGVKIIARTGVNVNNWHHVFITYDGSRTAAGLKLYVNGELQGVDVFAMDKARKESEWTTFKVPQKTIKTKAPLTIGKRTDGQALKQVHVQDLRLYDRIVPSQDVAYIARAGKAAAALAKAPDKRTPAEADDLYTWWLSTFDKPYQQIQLATGDLFKREAVLKSRGTVAHVSSEKMAMPEAYVLNRGDYDKRKEKVGPDTPKVLPPFPTNEPKNRLGFARWLFRPEHPLTARVTVNRFWQELFGAGLVRTPGDFGITGEQPTHPELLDWLALDFQKDWDVKRFFKQLVMSNTYRQSAALTPEKAEKDPLNKLISRGPRFRMDAEMIRDTALAASGLLVPKIGGPSVRPYQPEGVWEAVAMIGSNTRDYKADKGENLYRRSLYTFWKRAAPPASMEVLNAPNRETCSVKRERTNTPLQALLTLNDVQFVEAARVLAEKAMKGGKEDGERIAFISERLIARLFTPDEMNIITASLASLRAEYKAKPEEAKKLIAFGESKADAKLDVSELAAWTMLANQVMNLDEVLNK
jgi:mono/diheme cytochrome c family protein